MLALSESFDSERLAFDRIAAASRYNYTKQKKQDKGQTKALNHIFLLWNTARILFFLTTHSKV
jgi:hypothetical protein